MFRYLIRGKRNGIKRPVVIAQTNFVDLAEYIATHVAEALDPDGSQGFEVEVIDRPEASYFLYPATPKAAQTGDTDADS